MLARGSSMPCEARCSPGNLVLAERLSSRSRPRVKTCGADVRRRRRRPLHRSSVVMAAVSESCCRDLLVVGPGVLGSLVCQRWLKNASEFVSLSLTRRSNGHAQTFPAATVIGQTNTDASHERLVALGISPRLKADAGESRRFPFVVFSAPPSGSDDYTAEVEAALKLWDGTGGFVFTSSTAVYAGKDGEDCDETTAQFQIGESPRADKLLNAEAAVLGAGGCVVRLSGLYHSQRGAHMYFLKTPTLASRPDALVNLVHYEDAAAACVRALSAQLEGSSEGGEIFLATDGVPVTREKMVEACLACPDAYDDGAMPEFSVSDGPLGKSMTNPQTREKLGWEPVYPSFVEFVAAGAKDSFYPPKKKNTWS